MFWNEYYNSMEEIEPGPKCMLELPYGIDRGSMIRVRGIIPPAAQRFSINFRCDLKTDFRNEVAFHLNPRFTEMDVIRNHFICNQWGPEERSGAMPLARNDIFEALIECEEQGFKVSFNGREFCGFAHRVPHERITHVMVNGDVNVWHISLELSG